jgi:hypothetical protein
MLFNVYNSHFFRIVVAFFSASEVDVTIAASEPSPVLAQYLK